MINEKNKNKIEIEIEMARKKKLQEQIYENADYIKSYLIIIVLNNIEECIIIK